MKTKREKEIKEQFDQLLNHLAVIRESMGKSANGIRGTVSQIHKVGFQLNNFPPSREKIFMQGIVKSNMQSSLLSLKLYKETDEVLNILRDLIENAIKEDR